MGTKQTIYKNEYAKEHYTRFLVTLSKDKYNSLKAYCDSRNVSVNSFVKQAIDEKISRDVLNDVINNMN